MKCNCKPDQQCKNGITFSEYQSFARTTAVYPDIGANPYYPAIGLCGEVGEVANKVKKVMRDHDGLVSRKTAFSIAKEMGDCLWYLAALASELQIDLSVIAAENMEKLQSRKDRGTLQGAGDDR